MNRSITAGVMAALTFLCAITIRGAEQPDRPNIVWISLEDITPMMGCYGDKYARTPVFDELAAEGIRYTKEQPFFAVFNFGACHSSITKISESDDAKVIAALQAATNDDSVSVRITAADGLFNLGRYEDGLPAIIVALNHPVPAAQIRASGILDTQPPSANAKLQPAIEALKRASQRTDVKRLPGIPYGLNTPFKRALKAITGAETYHRWGPVVSERNGD